MNEINSILVTLGKYLETNISKYQESSLKLMKKLFSYFDNYQKLVPDTVSKLLNLYHLNHQVLILLNLPHLNCFLNYRKPIN